MKQLNHREFTVLLSNNGFTLDRVRGSHEVWKRDSELVVVPHHRVNFMIQHRLIKKHKLKEV